jgi:hypothetical protein
MVVPRGETTDNVHFIDWYPPENRYQNATRWMDNGGKIVVVRNESRQATLSYELVRFYQSRIVQIFENENLIHEEIVGTGFHRYEIPFDGDCSIIRFFAPEGSERPVDFPELHNSDSRNHILAIRNVTALEKISKGGGTYYRPG